MSAPVDDAVPLCSNRPATGIYRPTKEQTHNSSEWTRNSSQQLTTTILTQATTASVSTSWSQSQPNTATSTLHSMLQLHIHLHLLTPGSSVDKLDTRRAICCARASSPPLDGPSVLNLNEDGILIPSHRQ